MLSWLPSASDIVSSTTALAGTIGAEFDMLITWTIGLAVLAMGIIFVSKRLRRFLSHVGKKA